MVPLGEDGSQERLCCGLGPITSPSSDLTEIILPSLPWFPHLQSKDEVSLIAFWGGWVFFWGGGWGAGGGC